MKLTASVAVCLLALAIASSANAGTGGPISMPDPPKTSVRGLALSLDYDWVDGPGYCPVTFTVTCTQTPATDRTLTIWLTNRCLYGRDTKSVTVVTDIEIPAGSTTVTKLIPQPQSSEQRWLSLDVRENGRLIDDLSFENRYLATAQGGPGDDTTTILFVAPKQVDVSQLAFLFDPNRANIVAASGSPVGGYSAAQVPDFAWRPAENLYEDWINYSALDLICISLDDVKFLADGRPRVWHALRQWTSAGGNLCVYGVGADWEGLEPLDKLLRWSTDPRDREAPADGWQEPPEEFYGVQGPYRTRGSGVLPGTDDSAKLSPPETAPFVHKAVGLGKVIAMGDPNPFPGKRIEWQWMFNTLGDGRYRWPTRHGLAYPGINSGFDNLLVAEVGLPPIKSYRVLITVFVILIGPVNYWFLHRKGRLPLLLFTVPAAALLVSGGLFAYVLVADGFQTYLRARSYTELDQRNHQAVSWARLSYYAGLTPSRGLVFPTDTVILPLDKSDEGSSWRGAKRQLNWDDQQRLVRGWLGSRTPTQYVTLRAYETKSELTIAPAADRTHCNVVNNLGTDIYCVVVCDDDGKLHFGKNLAPAARRQLQAIADQSMTDALADMRSRLRSHPPEYPTDVSRGGALSLFGRRRSNYWNRGNATADPSTSLLEVSLRKTAEDMLSPSFEPRTYIAVVDRPADVVIGIEGAVETQSLHVIFARW